MSSIDFRKDERTVEVFKHNIKDFTERESYWGIIFKEDLSERGWECSVAENGVDNSGELISGSLSNLNVDKIIKFSNKDKDIFLEIKTVPEYLKNFFTFKVSSLKNCLKQNAYILLPRSDCYYCIGEWSLKYFLTNYPHKIYKGFSPNDLAVRIPINDIDYLIEKNKIVKKEWVLKAKNIINKNYELLFREKLN